MLYVHNTFKDAKGTRFAQLVNAFNAYLKSKYIPTMIISK